MTLELGSLVKFSFTIFFPIQPMPAARPVRVAASMIVFTSLLSDMLYIEKIFFFNCGYDKLHTILTHLSSGARRYRKVVIVIARIGHSPWGFSGPILQCFLRLLGEIGRQLI